MGYDGGKTISNWAIEVNAIARDKGWWDPPTEDQRRANRELARIALLYLGLSYQLEAVRSGDGCPDEQKPPDFDVEQADDEMVELLAKLALSISEVAEAIEEVINGRISMRGGEAIVRHNPTPVVDGYTKPEGAVVELGDALIRILDLCKQYGLDLESAVRRKVEYNRTRSYRHGRRV